MDLFTIAGACLRRWYITAPLLLVVAFFSYRAYAAVDPLYTSSRSVVVLPSLEEMETEVLPEGDDATPTVEIDNPYSGQGGSRFAVAVLTRNINSTAFEERLQLDEDAEQTYEADSSSQQPMIHIEATADSPEAVYDLLDQVVAEAAVVLDDFQAEAGAPEVTRYRIAPAVPAGPVEDATPSRLRAAGAIAVLGGGLVAATVVGVDALLASRRRRHEASVGTEVAQGQGGPRHREHSAPFVGDEVPAEPHTEDNPAQQPGHASAPRTSTATDEPSDGSPPGIEATHEDLDGPAAKKTPPEDADGTSEGETSTAEDAGTPSDASTPAPKDASGGRNGSTRRRQRTPAAESVSVPARD